MANSINYLSQIVNGQIIQDVHVNQFVYALTGSQAYNLKTSGSYTIIGPLYATASWSTNALAAESATSASWATTAASALNANTASWATNAINANTADSSTSTSGVTGYYIPSGSGVAAAGILKMFAGASKTTSTPPYTAIVTVSPVDLTGKTLNQNLFIGLAPSQSGATVGATINSPTAITFVSNLPSIDFTFIGTYI